MSVTPHGTRFSRGPGRRAGAWSPLLVLGSVLLGTTACAAGMSPQEPLHSRNVILMIGDGFGPTTWEVARTVLMHDGVAELHLDRMMDEGRLGLVRNSPAGSVVTDSATSATAMSSGSVVTDSAASATAMSSGVKTLNGMVGMDVEGADRVTVLEEARSRGLATGVVTTARVSHATPAAFVVAVPDRDAENRIAAAMAASPPDVLLGGGGRHWLPAGHPVGATLAIGALAGGDTEGKRADGRNLVVELRDEGYTVVTDVHGLAAAAGTHRLLGLFSASHVPFALDRRELAGGDAIPTLAGMVGAALRSLAEAPGGFFLMGEGGRIDHAGHDNDIAAEIREVEEFDAAIGVALDFAAQDGETLVLVTADHETGGRAFGYFYPDGPDGEPLETENYVGDAELDAILTQRISFATMRDAWLERAAAEGRPHDAGDVVAVVGEATGREIPESAARNVLDPRELDSWHRALVEDRIDDYPLHRLGRFFGHTYGVVWPTGGHTNSPVYLIGYGPGADSVLGMHHLVDVREFIRAAFGWEGS